MIHFMNGSFLNAKSNCCCESLRGRMDRAPEQKPLSITFLYHQILSSLIEMMDLSSRPGWYVFTKAPSFRVSAEDYASLY
jgi:hypothetical protein